MNEVINYDENESIKEKIELIKVRNTEKTDWKISAPDELYKEKNGNNGLEFEFAVKHIISKNSIIEPVNIICTNHIGKLSWSSPLSMVNARLKSLLFLFFIYIPPYLFR